MDMVSLLLFDTYDLRRKMNKTVINKLFKLLETRGLKYKVAKYKKNDSRKKFIQRLEKAQNNIHLFGLNFPNYFTTRESKIINAFKTLEKQEKYIDVYIYMPTNKVRNHLNSLNIYKKENTPQYNNTNIYMLRELNKRFHYLNVKLVIYDQLFMFGGSAIDLGTNDAFVHLSKVKRNELIENAEYFNIKYKNSKLLVTFIKIIFERIENKYIVP
jgi:hypothetical protein